MSRACCVPGVEALQPDRAWGLGFRVQGSGCRVLGVRVQGSGCRVLGVRI